MLVFLDFEASSLAEKSYPVEVAWVFEDGRARSSLLRPLPEWTGWSAEAERLHGLSRGRLTAEGAPVQLIAREMLDSLSGHRLFASAPSWDGKWLSVLLRGAGLPRHALRLGKSDDAFVEAAREILGTGAGDDAIAALVARVIADTEPRISMHRALADARLERERWMRVRDLARILAAA
jgi:hypothetical protein